MKTCCIAVSLPKITINIRQILHGEKKNLILADNIK